MQSIIDRELFVVSDPPDGRNIVKSRWVYTTKENASGMLIRRKARMVAKVFTQQKGIDYDELFSAVVKFETVRFLVDLWRISDRS